MAGLSGFIDGFANSAINAGANYVNGRINSAVGRANGFLQQGLSNPLALLNNTSRLTWMDQMQDIIRGRPDPLMGYMWCAFIDAGPEDSIDYVWIEEVQTPATTFEPKPIFRNGKIHHYAAAYSADQMSVKLFTESSGKAFAYVHSWINQIKSTDGYFSLPVAYKRDVTVYIMDPMYNNVVTYQYKGCWPTSAESYQLSSQSNLLETTLSLSVDEVLIDLTNVPGGLSNTGNSAVNNSSAFPGRSSIR